MKQDMNILAELGMLNNEAFTLKEVLALMSLARQSQDEFNRRIRRHTQSMINYAEESR